MAFCALPGQARAGNIYGDKVDDSVATLAAASAPDAPLDVIVFGKDLASVNQALGLTPTNTLATIGAEAVTIKAADLGLLAAQAGTTYVDADVPLARTGTVTAVTPTASTVVNRYPIIDGATKVWNLGYNGTGIGIVVIDSGVTPAPDFGTRLTQALLPGQAPGLLNDDVGHGTFVASVAAGSSLDGQYAGVAPGASIYALNVARAGGARTSDVIAALDWTLANAATAKIRVVSLSLSETVEKSYLRSALDAMVERLWRAGIVVVTSAGNMGSGGALYAPGNDPFAISAGALDDVGTLKTTDDAETPWSSKGLTQDGFAKPELLAPGRRIAGLLPATSALGSQLPLANNVKSGYGILSGTSFSAPQVAGAVALIAQARPTWTPDQIKWVLMRTARSVASGSAGGLDVYAAVTYAKTPGTANQGIALSTYADPSWTTAEFKNSSWNNSSWNNSSWNNSSWNGSKWNNSSWNNSSWNNSSWNIYEG